MHWLEFILSVGWRFIHWTELSAPCRSKHKLVDVIASISSRIQAFKPSVPDDFYFQKPFNDSLTRLPLIATMVFLF